MEERGEHLPQKGTGEAEREGELLPSNAFSLSSSSSPSCCQRTRSVEILVPTFHDERRQGTIPSAVFNLISTILGGGVLSLPFAIRCMGLLPGVIMLLLVAAAADSSVYTLVSCSRRSGAQTFEGVAQVAFGRGAKLIGCLLIASVTFLPLVAYTVLLRDLASPMAEQYIFGRSLSLNARNGLTTLLVALASPACAMQDLNALNFLSALCVLATFILALAVTVRSAECVSQHGIMWDSLNLWPLHGIWGALQGLPVLVCSFVCHFNVLPLHGELQRPTRRRLHKVVHVTMSIVTLFYLLIGLTGYIYGACAGTLDYDNILNAFSSTDPLINAGRVGILFTIILSFPLLVIPCRDMLIAMSRDLPWEGLGAEVNTAPQSSLESVSEENSLSEPLMPMGDPDEVSSETKDEPVSATTVFSLTAGILLASTGLAFFVQYVTIIWDVLGSFSNMIVSFVIPCWAYLRIRKYSNPRQRPGHRKRWCRIILTASVVAIIACSVESIRRYANVEPVTPDD
jgi:amino acid permease